MTDVEIINLYWNKDQSAINQSQQQYGGYCCAIARSILNSSEDAEECVNDTWLKAWNVIPPQRPNKLSLFFGKITRNLALNKYKKDRTQKRGGAEFAFVLDELDECVPSLVSVEQTIADRELEQLVNHFLHQLPERECNIFLLRYWFNKSLAEIGQQLSMKESNVKASLFRSRLKLKNDLEKEGAHL